MNNAQQTGSFSSGSFIWAIGVVEDRNDPEKLGRVRVRIYGYHSDDKEEIKTEDLMWCPVVGSTTSASFGGIGHSPTGLIPGSTVFGFFADGQNAQNFWVLGTLYGQPGKCDKEKGFNDPEGIYTRYEDGEADTNRMARNDKIDKTPADWRKKKVDTASGAFGAGWSEPATPYAAEYPFNHVVETEPKPKTDVSDQDYPGNCGHVIEMDDTPGAERLLVQHKKGTFTEIHPDGSEVNKVVSHRYVVVEGNEHLHVLGSGKCTIDGSNHVLIKGNANIEVMGNCKETIHGNYDLTVGGNMDVNVGGHCYVTSGAHIKMTAPRIDLN